jgi:hypothetical protein
MVIFSRNGPMASTDVLKPLPLANCGQLNASSQGGQPNAAN